MDSVDCTVMTEMRRILLSRLLFNGHVDGESFVEGELGNQLANAFPEPFRCANPRITSLLRYYYKIAVVAAVFRAQGAILLAIGIFVLSAATVFGIVVTTDQVTVGALVGAFDIVLAFLTVPALLNEIVDINRILFEETRSVLYSWIKRLDRIHSAVRRVTKVSPLSSEWMLIDSYFDHMVEPLEARLSVITSEERPLSICNIAITPERRNNLLVSMLLGLCYTSWRAMQETDWFHERVQHVADVLAVN